MPHTAPLAETMAGSLSNNALRHLREARVMRIPERTAPAEELRGLLMRNGLPVYEGLLSLETRAGGTAFPGGKQLGAVTFLQACPSLDRSDLPVLDGSPLFPIFGDPEHLADWESPFGMLSPSGEISIYDAPYEPVLAFRSLAQFLEFVAFAPLSRALHRLRVDAFCGELLAGLLGAFPHPALSGDFTFGWVGEDVWVQEQKLAHPEDWSSLRGTFVSTERPEILVDLIPLLLEQGFSLGHQGPTTSPRSDEPEVVSFIDSYPELGYRAKVRVQVWGTPAQYTFSHQQLPANFQAT